AKDVIGPGDVAKSAYGHVPGKKKCFDVLLVDESHRLKQYRNIVNRGSFKKTSTALGLDYQTCSEADWILDQARIPVFFYDPLQAVKPSSPSHEQFLATVGSAAEQPISLTEQMRCGGGSEYLEYVRDIIWGRDPEGTWFEDYEFELHEDFLDFKECFEETLAENDLTRMVAGFAWPWATKGKAGTPPETYDMEIEGIRLKWNCVQEGWVDRGLEDPDVAREVGCIHTIQGYDLSNAFVIIGPDMKYDAAFDRPMADRGSYYDSNGKNGTTEEELLGYLRNIYYVLLTRGIESTHVYVCDSKLRDYFRRFFVEDL
ncbi:MAG: DNA/RNA helicase domain-containing protein, partial [Atopobiaceae bacterium]|nr:DNA/RNA helicase domain-containing protein [Atopobiaceae bacterium]